MGPYDATWLDSLQVNLDHPGQNAKSTSEKGIPGIIYVVWGPNHISPDLLNVYSPNTYINPPVSYAEV